MSSSYYIAGRPVIQLAFFLKLSQKNCIFSHCSKVIRKTSLKKDRPTRLVGREKENQSLIFEALAETIVRLKASA